MQERVTAVTTMRVGSTKKFSAGWDRAFGGKPKTRTAKASKKAATTKPKRAKTKKKRK